MRKRGLITAAITYTVHKTAIINFVAQFRKQYKSAIELEATLGLQEMAYVQLAMTAEVLNNQKSVQAKFNQLESKLDQLELANKKIVNSQQKHSQHPQQSSPDLEQSLKRIIELLDAKSKS